MRTKCLPKRTAITITALIIASGFCIHILSQLIGYEITGQGYPSCKEPNIVKSNYTKQYISGCSVPMYTASYTGAVSSKRRGCSLCSNNVFKDFHKKSKGFVSDGWWNVLKTAGEIKYASFQTPFCSFSQSEVVSPYIENCFASHGIKKLIILGDSNAQRTFQGLMEILSPAIHDCILLKTEKYIFMPDIRYYLPNGTYRKEDLSIKNRRCRSCNAAQHRCHYETTNYLGLKQRHDIVLEYIPMNFINDTSIRIKNPLPNASPTNYTHEFVFRDYLRNEYPEVIVVVPPCIHEVKAGNHLRGIYIKKALTNLIRVVKKHAPKRTHVFWVPYHHVISVNETQHVLRCNDALYEALEYDLKDATSKMHATLDTYRISCPFVELRRPKDQYHMLPKWYELISRHLLEQICNGLS